MVPKRASDLKPFENQGAMLGLWRQCLRTMPGEFTCDDQPPGQGQAIKRLGEGDESPEVFCKCLRRNGNGNGITVVVSDAVSYYKLLYLSDGTSLFT